jgi:hypothetical protein
MGDEPLEDEEEDEDMGQPAELAAQLVDDVADDMLDEGDEDEMEDADDLMLEELEDMEHEQMESDEDDSGYDDLWRANAYGRGRHRNAAAQRDILNAILPARPRFLPPERRARTDDAWSEAEEQVSQILRNLRGLSLHSNSERQSYLDNDRSQLPNMDADTARYAIELDVLP